MKLFTGKPLSHQDLGLMRFPLGGSHGTTNAVMFGVVLDAFREPDMTREHSTAIPRPAAELVHHDVDAPPWWHLKKKSRLYTRRLQPRKTTRVLMQFMLLARAPTGRTVLRVGGRLPRRAGVHRERRGSPTYPVRDRPRN